MLIGSLLMMGLATFCVGLLPGYQTISVLAPILLVVLRFLPGIGLGGEWGGAVLIFLFSIVLVGIGLFVRPKLAETPVFREVMETRTEARVPILDVFRTHGRTVTLTSYAGILVFAFFYVVTVFSVSYGVTKLGLAQSIMLYCVMIAIAVMGAGILFFATISERVGRRNLTLLSTAFHEL